MSVAVMENTGLDRCYEERADDYSMKLASWKKYDDYVMRDRYWECAGPGKTVKHIK
ncbi:MAG: hypothetical protein J6K48_10790 [Lachnospiraceae bacterium]|nr:hypothetical protein [Lachnospiraceae bacterium]